MHNLNANADALFINAISIRVQGIREPSTEVVEWKSLENISTLQIHFNVWNIKENPDHLNLRQSFSMCHHRRSAAYRTSTRCLVSIFRLDCGCFQHSPKRRNAFRIGNTYRNNALCSVLTRMIEVVVYTIASRVSRIQHTYTIYSTYRMRSYVQWLRQPPAATSVMYGIECWIGRVYSESTDQCT